MLVQRYTSGRVPRTGTVIGVRRRDYHSRLTGATRMPRHGWSALYAPEDPPILAAVSSRSWGRSRRPRFHGDDQSRLGSSWLVPAAKAKAPLAQEQLFLPRRARGVAAGPALDNDHPFVRLLDDGIKKASPPEGRRLALTSHPFVTGRSLVFETRPFALLPWRKATWFLREHGLDLSFLESRRATARHNVSSIEILLLDETLAARFVDATSNVID